MGGLAGRKSNRMRITIPSEKFVLGYILYVWLKGFGVLNCKFSQLTHIISLTSRPSLDTSSPMNDDIVSTTYRPIVTGTK